MEEQKPTIPVREGFDAGEPQTAFIGVFMAVSVVVLALIIVFLQAYYDRVKQQQVFEKVLAPVSEDLRDLRAREDSQLHSYQYLDRNRGVVRLPIERAMELLAKEAAEGGAIAPSSK